MVSELDLILNSSLVVKKISFTAGLSYSELAVFTVTALTKPSGPG